MKRELLRIDPLRCSRCGACTEVCPHRLLSPGAEGLPEVLPDAESLCIACGHCAAVCASSALSHREVSATVPPAPTPPPAEAVLSLLRARRSVRGYRRQSLSPDVVRELLEAARYSPTGHNARTVGCVALLSAAQRKDLQRRIVAFYRRLFRLVRTPGVPTLLSPVLGRAAVTELRGALPSMERVEGRLLQGEDPLFHGAPSVLLFHARTGETSEADCALAAGQVTLLAPSLGLGTCHIGYASAVLKRFPGMGRRFGIPLDHRAYCVLTAGYPVRSFAGVPPRSEIPVQFL